MNASAMTTENIMKLKQGMSSEEVLAIFDTPKKVNQNVCGNEDPWSCTTWNYCNGSDIASFTFSGEHGSYILNHFNIDR